MVKLSHFKCSSLQPGIAGIFALVLKMEIIFFYGFLVTLEIMSTGKLYVTDGKIYKIICSVSLPV